MLSPQSPSQVSHHLSLFSTPNDPPQPSQREKLGQDLQYWIETRSVTPGLDGIDTFLLACLEGLLRLDLENLPRDIMQDYTLLNEVLRMGVPMRYLWSDIRAHLDLYRRSLLALPDFMHRNFEIDNLMSQKSYDTILALCRRCIEGLEITESQHKDILELLRSEKATEMAELSIQESKRVMLCKSKRTQSIGFIWMY